MTLTRFRATLAAPFSDRTRHDGCGESVRFFVMETRLSRDLHNVSRELLPLRMWLILIATRPR